MVMATVVIERQVKIADTDSYGFWYHLTVGQWADEAEMHLWKAAKADRIWPRVHFSADYRQRLVLGDKALVTLKVAQVGTTSLGMMFTVVDVQQRPAAGGRMVVVNTCDLGLPQAWSTDQRTLFTGGGLVSADAWGPSFG